MPTAKTIEVQPRFTREGKHDMVSRGSIAGARILALAASAILLFVGSGTIAPQPAFAQAHSQTVSAPQADVIPGPDVCAGCHEEVVNYYKSSVHGQKGNLRGPANAGECSTCHGDPTEHVKAGGGRGVGGIKNPGGKSASMSAEDKNHICLTCHAGGSKRTHWSGSTHETRGNACTSCHTMHTRDKVLTKISQPDVCFTCHKQQRIEVNRTFRHPIPEGKVVCSDCHNPHGSIGRALMKRDSVVETCYQCHAEKRGPFVHAHDPVTEDCTICHNPHGTVADSMLKWRPPFLCQSCHTPHGGVAAQAFGQPGAASPAGKSGINITQGRGCLNCHTQIHGGNNPALTAPTP
ncbi:MAG TPA: DmsE family decaheme c-type cytochrome, partial [Burkholderiales bacterium]|nr:DmsE family decaheme c-type cytochrome [Burkholderiales bacterium]